MRSPVQLTRARRSPPATPSWAAPGPCRSVQGHRPGGGNRRHGAHPRRAGTGKELVGPALFQHSTRPRSPSRWSHCVAIPETLLESELFGYEGGLLTGRRPRIGKIEQADGARCFWTDRGHCPWPSRPRWCAFGRAQRGAHRGPPPQSGGRGNIGRHQPRPDPGGQGRALPRGPLLPPQRVAITAPPPGAARGRAPVGRLLLARVTPSWGCAKPGHTAEPTRCSAPTPGRASCATGQRHGEVPHLRPGRPGGPMSGHPGAGRPATARRLPEPRDGPGHPGLCRQGIAAGRHPPAGGPTQPGEEIIISETLQTTGATAAGGPPAGGVAPLPVGRRKKDASASSRSISTPRAAFTTCKKFRHKNHQLRTLRRAGTGPLRGLAVHLSVFA